MRIGIIALGSKRLTQTLNVVLSALRDLGHEATDASNSLYSLAGFEFLIFITETAGLFGALDASLALSLAKCEGLQGKRCLAMMRRGGLRPERALQRCMNALEHEGLVVVEGEVFSDTRSVETIVRNAPLRRA